MILTNVYTTPPSSDGEIVNFFETGFNGLIDENIGVSLLIFLSIVFAVIFSAAIGMQREKNGHPAGFRTHLLIGLGSALIMIISIYAAPGSYETRDPMRLAAAGVTGIGFLGAGAIIQNGFSIRGLTSAASIWITMAIGMCAGAGYFIIGFVVTSLTLIFLTFFHKIEVKASSRSAMIIIVTRVEDKSLDKIMSVCEANNIKVSEMSSELVKDGDSFLSKIVFRGTGTKKEAMPDLVVKLTQEIKPLECKILH